MGRTEEFADLRDDVDRVTQRFERANAGAYGVALAAVWGGSTKLKSDCQSARSTLETKVINESAGFLDAHWPAGAVS
ncbi:MAG TPA: hypothetical protein VFE45_14555 [Coriobacteriia bacterium]|nr:hypothetical protein [Coriobacteriia bacterium]